MTVTLLGRSAEVSLDQPVIADRTRRDPIAVKKAHQGIGLCVPAGAYHGAFKSQHGCLLCGIHYYDESKT